MGKRSEPLHLRDKLLLVGIVLATIVVLVVVRETVRNSIDSTGEAMLWAGVIGVVGVVLIAFGGRHLYLLRPVKNPPSIARKATLFVGAVIFATGFIASTRPRVGVANRKQWYAETHHFGLFFGIVVLLALVALIALIKWDQRKSASSGSDFEPPRLAE